MKNIDFCNMFISIILMLFYDTVMCNKENKFVIYYSQWNVNEIFKTVKNIKNKYVFLLLKGLTDFIMFGEYL